MREVLPNSDILLVILVEKKEEKKKKSLWSFRFRAAWVQECWDGDESNFTDLQLINGVGGFS